MNTNIMNITQIHKQNTLNKIYWERKICKFILTNISCSVENQ